MSRLAARRPPRTGPVGIDPARSLKTMYSVLSGDMSSGRHQSVLMRLWGLSVASFPGEARSTTASRNFLPAALSYILPPEVAPAVCSKTSRVGSTLQQGWGVEEKTAALQGSSMAPVSGDTATRSQFGCRTRSRHSSASRQLLARWESCHFE